jgi:CHAT domain-containing protein/Tfp pilus assembly protein PilF
MVRQKKLVFLSVLVAGLLLGLSGVKVVAIEESRWEVDSIAQSSSNTEADRLYQEGLQLFQEGSAESLRQAIPKFEAAAGLYQKADDQSSQALCFLGIGTVYSDLGEKQQALYYYNQALPLLRAVGDKRGEATTLNNISTVYSDLGEKQQALEYYNQALPLLRAVGDKRGEAITLSNIGLVYDSLGEKQQALEYYNQALTLSRTVGDREVEAVIFNNIGGVYSFLEEHQKALEYYNQALLLYRTVGNRNEEGQTLNRIGGIYDSLGEHQKALEYYNQALPQFRSVGNQEREATTLNNIGLVYDSLGKKQQALDHYNQALLLFRAIKNYESEAITLNNIGRVYDSLGEKQRALDYYNQALPLLQQVGHRKVEAAILNNIGSVYDSLGEKPQALEYYNQALILHRQVGDKKEEATTLNNIGGVYNSLGEKQKALEYFYQALPLLQQVGHRKVEATTLNNIGSVYDSLGEKQKALDFHNQALLLRRAVEDPRGEAITLINIGSVYEDLGETQQALDYYNQALPLFRAVGDREGEATALNNIGGVYDSLGETQQALDYYNQALPLVRAVGDREGEANALNNIGYIYSSLGDKQQALEYYNQALPLLQAVGDREGEALTLNNIGSVYNFLGKKQQALKYYNQALPLIQRVGNRSGESSILSNIAVLERDRGNLETARTHIETAITIIEDLRTKIGSQEHRQSYFATVQGYYEFYIDLLMQLHQQNPSKGYNAQALHISERARARSLLELLTEANADIRSGVDPQLLTQEKSLQQQLNNLDYQKYQLISGSYSDTELNNIQEKIKTTLTQLDQLEAQIRVSSPRYADLKYPEPLTLKEIQQQVLDEETILLEYSLGKDRSYLWAVTKDSITSYILPARNEIEAATEKFRDVVTLDSTAKIEAGLPLSQILLAPVASGLENKRLLIVSDGILQTVPFAALPIPSSPNTPLLAQNEIVTLPSASTVAIQRRQLSNRPLAAKTLAVLADPVFNLNDERIAGTPSPTANAATSELRSLLGIGDGPPTLDRLKYTRTEAEKILALVPESQRFHAFDFDATLSLAINSNLAQYQIVHLATHGLLNEDHPELSGIVLSLFDPVGKTQDGMLRLNDIFNLNWPVELVVLSACQTGLGESVQGEGLVGLTRGFMYAGARRVVVSLWSVNDSATAALMTGFYQKMLNEGQTPITALREAQLQMWNAGKSPYFWAAFTVQGDWQ